MYIVTCNLFSFRRYDLSQDSLFKNIPFEGEQELIHDFFMKTVDHKAMSFKARIKPDNSVWMEVGKSNLCRLVTECVLQDAKLKNLIICQPEHRNKFNKIFGGFIMRQAFELAWANTYTFRSTTTLSDLSDKNNCEIFTAEGDLFVCTWPTFGSELQ